MKNPEELQNVLNLLFDYTNKWDLTVNTNKIKLLFLGRLQVNENWYFNGYEFILFGFYFSTMVNLYELKTICIKRKKCYIKETCKIRRTAHNLNMEYNVIGIDGYLFYN